MEVNLNKGYNQYGWALEKRKDTQIHEQVRMFMFTIIETQILNQRVFHGETHILTFIDRQSQKNKLK